MFNHATAAGLRSAVLLVDWSCWRFNLARTGKLTKLRTSGAATSKDVLLNTPPLENPFPRAVRPPANKPYGFSSGLSLSSAHQLPGALGITLYSTQELKLQASLTSSNSHSCSTLLLQKMDDLLEVP